MSPLSPLKSPGASPTGPISEHEPLRRFFKAFEGYPPEEFALAFHRHEQALQRVMAREDLADVQVRQDGTLECTDVNGVITLRAAGWHSRT